LKLNQGKLEDYLYEALLDPYCGLFMAQTAEKCAAKYNVSRDEQDAYALRSQQAAAKAWAEGRFKDEVVPVELKSRKGVTVVDKDDHLRPETTLEGLAKLPAAFSKDGTVTAGNASGIVDGGAALMLASARAVKEKGLKPLARLVAWAYVGVDPSYMGMGPAPATRKALSIAGLTLDQIDLIEVNEAFAGQYLAVEKELDLDRDKVNVNGGAIALGHPLGMTGTRLLLTLTHELARRNKKYGLATACIGGGQGIAAIIESINN
jgi:acetyl-CoA acyltransferase 2